ncbi:ABC transporter permease [Clostridium sp. DJ247]|uniref:ABC transporter permease n=1 Tax=Clostridium sp. DJ247 TaxID=2726188 RepID=UPI001F4CB636|nr:ABC transporter permease [Clostridium sp. DJ247]
MNIIIGAYKYIIENMQDFQQAFKIHLELSLVALLVGILLSVPLGIVCAKNQKVSSYIMGLINSLRVIPSLAILIIIMPILGTGFKPALVALTVLACPPIMINTFIGIKGIESSVIEAATGIGMDKKQMLFTIEIPIAMPLIISGIKTAAVEVVSSATLSAFIGGGGLGTFIINGLGMYNFSMLLVGAIPVAILAVLSEVILAYVERLVTKYQRV